MEIEYSYSFDDVLITPKKSDIKSRSDISLYSRLTKTGGIDNKGIYLNMPIISSPMDTVTEESMGIAMAMNGGIGIIHRFQLIETQVEMVKKVKRYFGYIITEPYTIDENSLISELQELMNKTNVSGILVVNNNNKFVGVVSKKDIEINILNDSKFYIVKEIMTIKENTKYVSNINQNFNELFKEFKVKRIPIVDNNDNITGLISFKNLLYFHNNKDTASLDFNGKLIIGGAIGVNGDYLDRAKQLIEAGVDLLNIDVANGYTQIMYDTIKFLKKTYPRIPIMAGNVCTADGYKFLCEAGADCIRVGIGNGSICSTRLETGIGLCQFSALLNCSKIAKEYKVPMISDGGHNGKVGNKFKALAVGCNFVLLGRSLAGTTESPGKIINKKGKKIKYYRGQASALANISKQEKNGNKNINMNFHVEGVSGEIEYKGSVIDVLKHICNGMRSGMSYLGVSSINELHENDIKFTKITSSGINESNTRI